MKRHYHFLGILFFVCLETLVAQTDSMRSLEGFWGMMFGSTEAQCRKMLLSKEGATIDTKNSNADRLIIEGVKFAGRKVSFIRLSFYKGKLHTASVYYKPTLDSKAQELYDEIKSELNTRYFVTTDDFRHFKSPYRDGDGDEMTAVRLGLATISSFWIFDRADGNKNSIHLYLDEDLYTVLVYQDGKLAHEKVTSDKSHNIQDY